MIFQKLVQINLIVYLKENMLMGKAYSKNQPESYNLGAMKF